MHDACKISGKKGGSDVFDGKDIIRGLFIHSLAVLLLIIL